MESFTVLPLPVPVLSLTRVTAYFIRTGDHDGEVGLFKGPPDNECVLYFAIFQQCVVYWQTASVRLTEDLEGLSLDCAANQ